MKRCLYIAACLLPASVWAQTVGVDWEEATGFADFGRRRGHAAVVYTDRMMVLGGFNGKEWLGDSWSSADGAEWKLETESADWPGRAHHAAVVHDGRLWVLGGYNGGLLNDVWRSEDGVEWESVTPSAPWSARSQFAAETLNGRMYVLGGQEEWRRLNDAWSSENGIDWTLETESAPWPPRSHLASAVHDGRLYISGGARYDFEKEEYEYFNDVWYTKNGRDWTLATEHAAWPARYLHQTVSLRGRLWLIGGDDEPQSSAHLRDVWMSEDGALWTRVSDRIDIERRNLFVLLPYNDRLWIIGGMRYSGGIFDYKSSIWFSEGVLPGVKTE